MDKNEETHSRQHRSHHRRKDREGNGARNNHRRRPHDNEDSNSPLEKDVRHHRRHHHRRPRKEANGTDVDDSQQRKEPEQLSLEVEELPVVPVIGDEIPWTKPGNDPESKEDTPVESPLEPQPDAPIVQMESQSSSAETAHDGVKKDEPNEKAIWLMEHHRSGTLLLVFPAPWNLSARFLAMLNYFALLVVFLMFVDKQKTLDNFFLRSALINEFVSGGTVPFSNVVDPASYFDWLQTEFLNRMYPGTLGNSSANTTLSETTASNSRKLRSSSGGGTGKGSSGGSGQSQQTGAQLSTSNAIAGGVNYRLGKVRLRQLRVSANSCVVSKKFSYSLNRCFSQFSDSKQEKGSFDGLTWEHGHQGLFGIYSQMLKISYPTASGFIVELNNTYDENTALIQDLFDNTWIDFGTRVVFVEFNLFNPNVELVASCTLITEVDVTGNLYTSFVINVLPLVALFRLHDQNPTKNELLCFGLEMTMYGLVFLRIITGLVDSHRLGYKRWASNIFNKLKLALCVCFIILACFRASLFLSAGKIKANLLDFDRFTSLLAVAATYQHASDLVSIIAVILFVMVFDYIRFNAGIRQFTDALAKSFEEMLTVLIILTILLCGFSLAFFMEFGYGAIAYRDYAEAMTTLFSTCLGAFYVGDIQAVNREMGPLLFTFFIVLVIFVVLSMLFGIVCLVYTQSRIDSALNKTRFDDPVLTDLLRCFNTTTGLVEWFLPFTKRFIISKEQLKKLAAGKKESLTTIVSGRRGKKELMRQMKTTGIPQLDPEEHDSNAEASVDAHQAEDIQLMRRLSVKPRNSLRNSRGAILKAVEKEGAEAEAPALGSQGNFKKDVMTKLLLLEQRQRLMVQKMENLTNHSREDTLQTFKRAGQRSPYLSPTTPYKSPEKKDLKKRSFQFKDTQGSSLPEV